MPDSATPQLHSSTSKAPAAPTEDQLNALAAALHHNRPLPDLNLSETQLALLVDSDDFAKRLHALEKLTRIRHEAAAREAQHAADREALATLRKCMQSESPAQALRAAVTIYRGRPISRQESPRSPNPHRPKADRPSPAAPSPSSPPPTPNTHAASPQSLLNQQLETLRARKPQSCDEAVELLKDSLPAPETAGHLLRAFRTNPALALYLKHLNAAPVIEASDLHSGPLHPITMPPGTPSASMTVRVLLAQPRADPTRFHFHYTLHPRPGALKASWVLEDLTLDGAEKRVPAHTLKYFASG